MTPVACCLIFNALGKILLAQKPSGDWEFPGGKQHIDETLLQCAEREIAEELGLVIKAEKALEIRHVVSAKESHFELILVKCQWISGEIALTEHLAARWFSSKEIDYLLLSDGDRVLWRLYKEK